MKMPAAFWSMTYSASRRQHSHRCQCCRKVVQEGEAIIMARVVGKATRVMHEECADKPFAGTPHSGRNFLEYWGMEYLATCSWTPAKAWLEASPLNKPMVA